MAKTLAPKEILRKEVEEENKFVQTLIDSIPPKVYFGEEVLDYLEQKKCLETDINMKEFNVKTNMASKGKHKRAKLNPFLNQTVTEVINEIETLNGKHDNSSVKTIETASVEDLREKLKAKIEAMQSMRHRGVGVSRETKRLQHKAAKLKLKKEKKLVRRAALNGGVTPQEIKTESITNTPTPSKPVFNKEGKIVYSKFDLCENSSENKNKKSKKRKLEVTLKRAVKQVKTNQEKLQKLEEEDPEKAVEVTNKQMWKRAIDKTEGLKLKDDPELLKKTLKKRKQQKKQSQKKWKERTEHVEALQKQRQDKRKSNIQARKREKVDKKIQRAKKKGKIPGF